MTREKMIDRLYANEDNTIMTLVSQNELDDVENMLRGYDVFDGLDDNTVEDTFNLRFGFNVRLKEG